jgi:AcrR family transcriptional regulator
LTDLLELLPMAVNEKERERAMLDAAADLLLRRGYDRLTMGDVADAVALHRGLVYVHFKSKDDLVDAVLRREWDRYADVWREQVETDPRAGTVASVYRAMVHAPKALPLASAVVARDMAVLGKYLRKPANVFEPRSGIAGTREFLELMRAAGTVRRDVDIRAAAFILDALTPALRRTFPTDRETDPANADQPTSEELLEALADILEHSLNPAEGADLAAGKAVLLAGLTRLQRPHRGRPFRAAMAGVTAPRRGRRRREAGADALRPDPLPGQRRCDRVPWPRCGQARGEPRRNRSTTGHRHGLLRPRAAWSPE